MEGGKKERKKRKGGEEGEASLAPPRAGEMPCMSVGGPGVTAIVYLHDEEETGPQRL